MSLQNLALLNHQQKAVNSNLLSSQSVPTTNPTQVSFSSNNVMSNIASQSLKNTAKIHPYTNFKSHPITCISFTGDSGKNPYHYAHLMAEIEPFSCAGGEGMVGRDFTELFPDSRPNARHAFFIPYYNGEKIKDDATGEIIGHKVRERDGKLYYLDNKTNTEFEIEKVNIPETTIKWGQEMAIAKTPTPVTLYKLKADLKENLKIHKNSDIYFVYTPLLSEMQKQYGDAYRDGDMGNAYSQFCAATKEFLPKLNTESEHSLNPENIYCHDWHTSFFLAQANEAAAAGDAYYQGIKPGYIVHNLGRGGYQGLTASYSLFCQLATDEQIATLNKDKEFIELCKDNYRKKHQPIKLYDDLEERVNKYFKKIMPDLVDEMGKLNPSMVPFVLAERGQFNIATVSENHAQNMCDIPDLAEGLIEHVKKLRDMDRFRGITNGSPEIHTDKPLVALYSKPLVEGYLFKNGDKKDGKETIVITVGTDGKIEPEALGKAINVNNNNYTFLKEDLEDINENSYTKNGEEYIAHSIKLKGGKDVISGKVLSQPFKTFKLNDDGSNIDEVMEAKSYNKRLFLNRLKADRIGTHPEYAMPNYDKSKNHMFGHIDEKYIDNPETKLVVGWGRGDFQKGIDTTIIALEKMAEADPNAVFVFGATLENKATDIHVKAIADALEKLLKEIEKPDSKLKGRFAYFDGYAPGHVMACAGDYSLFGSRFEPCGLTQLESMKFGCIPIVPNTGGMGSTVFDPDLSDDAGKKHTGFKTKKQFYMTTEDLKREKDVKLKYEYKDKEKNKNKTEPLNFEEAVKALDEEIPTKTLTEYKAKYANLLINYRNEAMAVDFAETLTRALKLSPEERKSMAKNALLAKIGWNENGDFNKIFNDGIPALEAHLRYFFENPNMNRENRTIAYQSLIKMDEVNARVNKEAGQIIKGKSPISGKTAATIGIATGTVLALGYYVMSKTQKAHAPKPPAAEAIDPPADNATVETAPADTEIAPTIPADDNSNKAKDNNILNKLNAA